MSNVAQALRGEPRLAGLLGRSVVRLLAVEMRANVSAVYANAARKARWAAMVAVLGVAACGSPEVLLSLATVEGDTPWLGVARLEVAVSVAGARVGRAEEAVGSGELSLPGLPVDEDVEVWASGLDPERAVRSFGHAVIPKGDRERCCVTMCFCSVELFDQGACTCGSDGCEGGC